MGINRERLKKNITWMILLLGMVIIFAGYIAWGILTISYKAPLLKVIGVLFTYIIIVMYILFTIIVIKAKRYAESRQLCMISSVGLLISLMLLFNDISYSMLLWAWVFAFGAISIYGIFLQKRVIRNISLVNNLKKNVGLICLLLITSILIYDKDAIQFKWDGLLYYITCNDLDISSLSNLAIYGHIAQTYGMLIGLGNIMIGNTTIVMMGLNVLLMLGSVCGFYAVLKELVLDKKESQYIITTAVYAWSPFLLGMVHYHSLDFYCQCLFIWVLFALYKRKWIYFSVFSLLFCFTKEPAIIIYGAMCVGVVIVDFVGDGKYSYIKRIKRLFGRKKYYLMVLPGILWIVTYKMLGPWSAGDGGFSVDLDYVLCKLKNLYILNFNWVFFILAIWGSVFIFVKKERRWFELLLPIWCSQIAFTLFSCLFKTVNHPRYNDTNQVTLYLLALIPLLYYCEQIKYKICVGILSIACLVSSFTTCDPLTLICYEKADIGTTTMIYTSSAPLGDGMIYNRQMLGFEKALGMALKDALKDSDIIIFPTIHNNAYAFDGMAEVMVIQDDYMIEREFWDIVHERRTVYKNDETKEFQVYQLTNEVDWGEMESNFDGNVNYICIPTINDNYSKYIEKKYHVLEKEEYEYKGWKISRLCFNVNM